MNEHGRGKLGGRGFWLTMLNRTSPEAAPTLVFTTLEIQILDKLVRTPPHPSTVASVSCYLTKLAQLGGYLARACDPLPGNQVIRKGTSRLTDIELGYQLAQKSLDS